MLCALIMAGGKGERFWPLSTDEKPKQFLKLLGEKTMIQMTVERLLPIISIEDIFVVTARRYVEVLREQLPNLPKDNIIVEPVGRNTAPCIALSAFMIKKHYDKEDTSIVVLPSDHLIVDENEFRNTIRQAYKFVMAKENSIVTLGIKPDRPETGYGYIKLKVDSEELKVGNRENKIHKVEKFVEKPDLKTAEEYLKKGNFLWNCGMFVWKCDTILNLTERYLNNTYKILNEIANASEVEFEDKLMREYPKVDNVSVDYAIMEKAKDIYVIPSDFGWDDIGTWYAVERYREKDDNNNICIGDIKNIDASNNIVFSKEKPIVVVGMDDVFVVESDNIIFVGKKKDIERIKEIKKKVN
ncbi:mannose-1-phosphate guanylyltransferase [Clostridium sp. JN-1]|uniref:mannose-1-phosphate guanylyltransferase n=1 Tax=Clostridium sp. JN-1 TaxID=2483110 RepID=UPI000F0BC24E|nr:mannose-1-phosphate guanylyltransferase [Clostridium sp. JN-1]